jgi:cytochrome c2
MDGATSLAAVARACGRPLAQAAAVVAVAAVAVAGMSALAACGAPAKVVPGGDPSRGPAALQRYGCIACHVVPGVAGAHGRVGPALTGIADRSIVAGRLPNTPENLIGWIQDPQAVSPGTVMPNMGVSEADARDIAAYLYTLG